jgi:methionine synthase / methylenetetrahydrofolate reductase(NADPH)
MVNKELFKRLQSGPPILADGAMGTELHASGIGLGICFDELNICDSDRVLNIHRKYIKAGAELIETNTFGANRYKLTANNLDQHLLEINQAGVGLARQAASLEGKTVWVAGSIGPLGVRLAPFGRVTPEQAHEAYSEQIKILADAGVDLIIIETQTDLYEAQSAVKAAREVSNLPIVATVTFTSDDRTLMGDDPARVARMLKESGATVIGANCSVGPAQLLRITRSMRQAVPEFPLSVMPNAGWPERVAGRILYSANEDYFADYAAAFRESGVNLIGGCCGTTPEHIAAMRAALDSPTSTSGLIQMLPPTLSNFEAPTEAAEPTRLEASLANSRFTIAVEMDPPKGFSTHKLIAGASMLAEVGADVINVADSPMARMRMSPWAACRLIQREIGLETVLHFPTRGRNLLRIQGDLLASHALGVRNVFVVMGDPTAIGDYPDAMDNYDVVPSGLIKLISHGFNAGLDHAGGPIGAATSFFTGCALNLGASDIKREMKVLRRKIEAGADFALSQPVYDPMIISNFIERYHETYGDLTLPILAGVLPIYNHRHASFLHNEVPGINIPQPLRERIKSAGDNAATVGVEIAIELVDEIRNLVQGLYIMPAFGHYNLAAEIIEAVKTDR